MSYEVSHLPGHGTFSTDVFRGKAEELSGQHAEWVWMTSLFTTDFAAVNLPTGAATANFNLANVRITMATMPGLGRNHFFALFIYRSQEFGTGRSYCRLGLFLDALGNYEVVRGAFHWRRHSIYFLALLALNTIAFAYIRACMNLLLSEARLILALAGPLKLGSWRIWNEHGVCLTNLLARNEARARTHTTSAFPR